MNTPICRLHKICRQMCHRHVQKVGRKRSMRWNKNWKWGTGVDAC